MICYTCSGWQTGGLQRRYDGSLGHLDVVSKRGCLMESKRTSSGSVLESFTPEEMAVWIKAGNDRRDFALREGMYFVGGATAEGYPTD